MAKSPSSHSGSISSGRGSHALHGSASNGSGSGKEPHGLHGLSSGGSSGGPDEDGTGKEPVRHAITAKLALELQSDRVSDHWKPGNIERFVIEETRLRELNREASLCLKSGATGQQDPVTVADDLFISHCWRDPKTQVLKRRLVCELSRVPQGGARPGYTYWADFLDLAATGPVNWRKEIEEGIEKTAKFVAIIDYAFISSFNCLQELFCAMENKKPVVPVIIDDACWSALVSPIGAEKMWNDTRELQEHEGSELVGGHKFNLKALKKIFAHVSNINFCPCREVDFLRMGDEHTLSTFCTYVSKDIVYLKEHSYLTDRATAWLVRGKPKSTASLLNGEDISTWNAWRNSAVKYAQEPPPSDLQHEYISTSISFSSSRKRLAIIVGVVLVALVLAGALAAGLMAGVAQSEANRAEVSEAAAVNNALEANLNYDLALEQALLAMEQTALAEQANQAFRFALVELILSSLRSQLGSTTLRASELKVLDGALDIIEGTDREAAVVGHLQSRLSTAKWIQQTPLNGRTPQRVEWSPLDPNVLTTSSELDTALLVWDLQNADSIELVGHTLEIWDHCYSPNGTHLMSVSSDGTARVWNMLTLQETRVIQVGAMLRSVAWSAFSDSLVAIGDSDGVIVLLSLTTGESKQLTGHVGGVHHLTFSAVDGMLASSSYEGSEASLLVWDPSADVPIPTALAANAPASGISWHPQTAGLLASALDDFSLRTWDVTTGTFAVVGTHTDRVFDVNWHPNGTLLASSSADQQIYVWEPLVPEGTEPLLTSVLSWEWSQFYLEGDNGWARRIRWSPSGRGLVYVADAMCRVWDQSSLGNALILDTHDYGPVNTLAFSPNSSQWLAAAHGSRIPNPTDNSVSVWDANTGTLVWDFRDHTDAVQTVGWSLLEPEILASVGLDDVIMLWNVTSGAKVGELVGHTADPWDVSFSPVEPNRAVTTSNSGEVILWDTLAEVPIFTFINMLDNTDIAQQVLSAAWLPLNGGTKVLFGDRNGNVKLLDTITKEVTLFATHKTQVFSIVFSHVDTNMVASGSFDGTINVYNMSSGASTVLLGHTNQVYHLDWSPTDPGELVSSSRDGTTRIWKITSTGSGAEELELVSMVTLVHGVELGGVSYSPSDPNRLAFGYLPLDPNVMKPVALWDIFRWTTEQWRSAVTDMVSVGDTKLRGEDLIEWGLPLDILDL